MHGSLDPRYTDSNGPLATCCQSHFFIYFKAIMKMDGSHPPHPSNRHPPPVLMTRPSTRSRYLCGSGGAPPSTGAVIIPFITAGLMEFQEVSLSFISMLTVQQRFHDNGPRLPPTSARVSLSVCPATGRNTSAGPEGLQGRAVLEGGGGAAPPSHPFLPPTLCSQLRRLLQSSLNSSRHQ